jgi:hypothetical protein
MEYDVIADCLDLSAACETVLQLSGYLSGAVAVLTDLLGGFIICLPLFGDLTLKAFVFLFGHPRKEKRKKEKEK